MFVVSAIYTHATDHRFDEDYYLSWHRKMVEDLLAPFGFKGLRILKGRSSLKGSEAPYLIIAEMHFDSEEGFKAGMAEHGDKILADAGNYTNLQPILQVSDLLVG